MASSSSSAVPGSLRTNYARIGHAAQQLFPDILQELIKIKKPPQRLSHDVHKNNYLSKKLRPDEWVMINNVVTKGYANFDIPFIYKLVRNLNLVPPPTKGWNYPTAPSPTEFTTGDDIERIRRFRNETLHRGNAQVTETELSQYFTEFKNIAIRLEIYLGKHRGEFVDKLIDLETCCMDEKTRDMYIARLDRLRESDEDSKKRMQAVEKNIDALKEKSTSQTEGWEKTTKLVDQLKSKEEVHGKEIKDLQVNQRGQTEGLEKTAKQVDKLKSKEEVHGKEIKDLQVNQRGQTEGLEKTAKQVDKLKSKEEVHGKEIKDLQVNQRGQAKGLEKTTKQVDKLKSKEEVHGKDIKDLQVNQQGQKEGLEHTTKQLDECKRETNKIGEIQTQHLERVENLEKETESLKLNEEVHGKEIKDLQVNHRVNFLGYGGLDIYLNDLKRREIDEITLPESFEKIKEVNKGSDALRDNDIVILVGIKGSGKSTIGKAIIKQYCEGNQDYDMIQLSTTTNLDCCNALGFFSPSCSRGKVLVFLDDLFGRFPSIYALKEHIMLLKWVHERRDDFKLKILCTVQAETKACVEKLFASDHGAALLRSAEIIHLHSTIYPRRDMLIKSGIDEKLSDNIIRQIKETKVKERIGFPALLSIYMNQELGIELFINPGNVFMKYLSSLKEGSAHDKMYFVILIHVLMTDKVFEENQCSKTQNTSDKESMCHIATTIFGNTLEFQKCDTSIERIIDEKEDGILMNINDSFNPYYCFKDEITPDFIFQYYKKEAFKKDYTKEEFETVLTTCSLNCIVSYFRPLTDIPDEHFRPLTNTPDEHFRPLTDTPDEHFRPLTDTPDEHFRPLSDTPDEPFVYIDSRSYQSLASHIVNIIQKDQYTPRVPEDIMSVKTLCMSPLLQDENFLNELMFKCDQLSIDKTFQTLNVNLGFDKIGSIKKFHLPSMLLHQSCRQLSMLFRENVKVVKMILQKVRDSREENVEICETINNLVMFSMEELCKENIDDKEVLELLWNFIMEKEVDCYYNQFLMNAWRNQCKQTVIWLQENVKTPNCLQMDQCFLYIFELLGEHIANWFLEQIPKSKQNKINMYNVFNQALERRRYDLMENIWKWENMILEDYRHDKQLNPNKNHADVKKNFANMFMNDVLKESIVRKEPFMWAFNTFKPHENYFDKTMIKKINRKKNLILK